MVYVEWRTCESTYIYSEQTECQAGEVRVDQHENGLVFGVVAQTKNDGIRMIHSYCDLLSNAIIDLDCKFLVMML